MRSATLIILIFSFYSIAIAQNSTIQGYYINANGDSIAGKFPNFKQSLRNPTAIQFISNSNSEILLTPKNCNLFEIGTHEKYVAWKGLRMTNAIEEGRLGTENLPDSFDSIHAFLRIIYQANGVTLYHYKDKIRENFFYSKKDKEIIELKKKLNVYYSGEHKLSSEVNEFRNQLKQQFPEQIAARQLQTRLDKLAYTETDLVKFMDLLNETKTAETKVKHPTEIFVGAGASFNALNISGKESYLETQVNHTAPISPAITFGAKFHVSPSGRILISPGLGVYTFNASGNVQLTSGMAEYSHKSEFKADIVVRPSATFGYNIINHTDLKWHASVGMGFAFLIGVQETQTTHYPASTNVLEYNPDPMVFVFVMETGLDLGKNIGVWINYQPPANTSRMTNKLVKISSAQVGINWRFRAAKG